MRNTKGLVEIQDHNEVLDVHYRVSYFLKVFQNFYYKNRIEFSDIVIKTNKRTFKMSKKKFLEYIRSNSDQQIKILKEMVNERKDSSILKRTQD